MAKLYIIISTYSQKNQLEGLKYSLINQSNKNINVHCLYDTPFIEEAEEVTTDEIVWDVSFMAKRYNDWGHSLREIGLNSCSGKDDDYILFTNGDNYYCPPFVEEMLFLTLPEVGVVYCDMVHSHPRPDSSSGGSYGFFRTEFRPNFCDIGAFIVRLDIARAIGYKHKHRDADASFISDILNYQKTNPFKIEKVNKVLFVHN